MSDAPIYIIGGTGFVGSAFVRLCVDRGLDHVVITRENYQDHVGGQCSLLVNANGNSKKPLAAREPLTDFDASVRSVRRTLVDFRFERYVLLSSCDVYADCSTPSATNEEASIDIPHVSPYGFHKHLAELTVRHAAARWLILRCGGFVGPGLWKNPIFDILRGGPLWLDPSSRLQFMSTDAAASIVLDLVDRAGNEIVNLCGRGTVALEEVIGAVGKPIEMKAGSPRVTYDVSIAKLARWCAVPDTRDAVLAFVRRELAMTAGSHV